MEEGVKERAKALALELMASLQTRGQTKLSCTKLSSKEEDVASSVEPRVRHIFADPPPPAALAGASDGPSSKLQVAGGANGYEPPTLPKPTTAPQKGSVQGKEVSKKPALSKLIEYPCDGAALAALLTPSEQGEVGVEVGGKDAFGLTALHKLAAWDRADLLPLLLPHLSGEEVNDRSVEGFGALHHAVEMGALRSAKALWGEGRVDKGMVDKKGRTAVQLAKEKYGSAWDSVFL